MPIYEYQCEQCGQQTEAIQRLDEPPLEQCPHCGGTLRKLMSAPSFQFKGTGWYVTDYADKGRPKGKSSQPSNSDATASGGESTGSAKESTKDSSGSSSSGAGDNA